MTSCADLVMLWRCRGYINYYSVYLFWLGSAVFIHLPSFQSMGIDVKADISMLLTIFLLSLLVCFPMSSCNAPVLAERVAHCPLPSSTAHLSAGHKCPGSSLHGNTPRSATVPRDFSRVEGSLSDMLLLSTLLCGLSPAMCIL